MRRLLLRLTLGCNSGCAHCTLGDMPQLADRPTTQAVEELVRARREGATEVVFMRGEPTLRRDLPLLAARARALGYALVQVQTNGRMLSYGAYLDGLARAGVDFYEVAFFGPDATIHDAIAAAPGAFEQTLGGLKNLVARDLGHLVTIPVLRANLTHLDDTVRLLASAGVRRVQLGFTRPVLRPEGWTTHLLPNLTEASSAIRAAIRVAQQLGMHADTEAVPLCHLDVTETTAEAIDHAGASGEVATDFASMTVVDLHREAPSVAQLRVETRPEAPECADCKARAICPRTWAAYQELHGTSEFRPFR